LVGHRILERRKTFACLNGQYNLTKVINYSLFLISILVVANLNNYSQFEHFLLIILFIVLICGRKDRWIFDIPIIFYGKVSKKFYPPFLRSVNHFRMVSHLFQHGWI
jgi:hypothetical protein